MKKEAKIPTYIWALVGIIVVAVIFLIVVQIPFISAQPKLEKQHQEDSKTIQLYKDTLADIENYRTKVEDLKAEYSKLNDEVNVNASRSPKEITAMLKKCKVGYDSFQISQPTVDKQGRKNSANDPLYSTDVKLKFTVTSKQLIDILDYFETVSDGSYYVDKVSLKSVLDRVTDKDSDGKVTSTTYEFSGKYEADITLKLYYFIPADKTPDALKKAFKDIQNGSSSQSSSSAASGASSNGSSSASSAA